MTVPGGHAYRSWIDEERFGMRTARANLVTSDTLPAILDFCDSNEIVLLIARCAVSELRTAQMMEQDGFNLMDTLIYYTFNLEKFIIPEERGQVLIRSLAAGEEQEVTLIASEAFRGYQGHYHADPRLPDDLCDAVYTSWAVRSCVSRNVADEVLVAIVDDRIVGFATLRLNTKDEGEGVLFGITPLLQKQGIYRSFMIKSLEWCRSMNAKRMVVSTQISNLAVQKVWSRVGFEPSAAVYTFHKWFH